MVNTWYGDLSNDLIARFRAVRVLICDVDGVFSDGRIYLGNQGEELKAFHTRDGLGVKALRSAGIEVAVVTGRQSAIVAERMQALGVHLVYQGQEQKQAAVQDILNTLSLTGQHAAAMGDDTPDLTMLNLCGLSVAVNDAHPQVQQQASYVTRNPGGFGAVREVADLILLAQGRLHQVQESST